LQEAQSLQEAHRASILCANWPMPGSVSGLRVPLIKVQK
jgi:hypothetical protein